MGIEKFFNSIKKSYGNKIISKVEKNTIFPDKYLLIDFNSIIHNVSQSIGTSIIYLYHIYIYIHTHIIIMYNIISMKINALKL